MIYWTAKFPKYLQDTNIILLNFNTLLLVVLASFVLITLAFLINFGNRLSKSKILDNLSIFSISGYAIPGIILGEERNIIKIQTLVTVKFQKLT